MSRVFILAPIPRFDISPAEVHGSVVYLFESTKDINPFEGQAALGDIVSRLSEMEFNPETDKLAMTGPLPTVAMLVLAAHIMAPDDAVTILVFDARDGSYRQRKLTPSALVSR